MNTKLQIKNFRVFDEQGVSIDIKPLTILTGCNSSGKSSIVKAAFLLNSFLCQIKRDYDNDKGIQLDKYKLDFTQYPNSLLGRFDKLVNSASSVKTITIEYSVYSLMLSKEINVQLVFSSDSNDDLNNAFLESLSMSTQDGLFFLLKGKDSYCNLNILRGDYRTFLLTEFMVHQYCAIESFYDLEAKVTKKEYEKEKKSIIGYLKQVNENRKRDVFRYVRTTKRKESLINKAKEFKVIEQIDDNGSIFSIPILDYLSRLNKNEVEQYIHYTFLGISNESFSNCSENPSINNKNKAFTFATKKVLSAFIDSSFESIKDFFFDYEKNYLEHVTFRKCPLGMSERSVGLFGASELSINQDYLFENPYNMHYGILSSGLFGEDDSDVPLVDDASLLAEKQERIKKWENADLTFEILYEVIMAWNRRYTKKDNPSYVHTSKGPGSFYHVAYKLLTMFAEALVLESICPDWCDNMSYVSSSRVSVKKLYSLEAKDDFTELLQSYFKAKHSFAERKNHLRIEYKVNDFMNRWIKFFGLGDSLSFQIDEDGLGVKIRLHKSAEDKGRLLADEGYGITQLVSILLQIETAIISAKVERVNHIYCLDDLDQYNTNVFHFDVNTIAIKEPEIHLHPSYQSKLAEMFAEAYKLYNIHFIIETHSEYLIRKFQTLVARREVEEDNISLNYVYSTEDYVSPSDSRVKHISINEDGSLSDSFGTGFFDEADNLSVELMSLNMRKS